MDEIIWIFKVECDFCNTTEPLYHVDFEESIVSYTACMKCIEKHNWNNGWKE